MLLLIVLYEPSAAVPNKGEDADAGDAEHEVDLYSFLDSVMRISAPMDSKQ